MHPQSTGVAGGGDFKPHKLQKQAAELYGRGMTLTQVTTALQDYIEPPHDDPEVRRRKALRKVRVWAHSQWFRDLAWEASVRQADLETGNILRGLTKTARRGRVDAAKMVMGVAGRYEEKGFGQAAQVNVVIEGVPRPDTRPPPAAIESQPTAEEWADEDEE